MSAQVQIIDDTVTRYATTTGYYRIFAEEMDSLYLLAFLLTADGDKAEQCFAGGFGECIDRIGVFVKWARFWARRAIVKHAIRMIRPTPEEGATVSFVSAEWPATERKWNALSVIASLCTFERFVFVLSVLERQSDEECQSLLRCSGQEVVMAREVALRILGAANSNEELAEEGVYTWAQLLS